ncbi:MCE family protein [Mycolicibacterium thermoresistibile]|nr:MCE family protein [Mycolicibacterium thermoresistibile]MCV7189636.1 MCE family protein [Mycolicibacterium thermoresistibile]SNW17510.1 virulence factor Mce family protein [Mycolicibacterium thermoresistibile]
MLRYRGAHLVRSGFIGLVVIILIIAVGLDSEGLLTRATAVRYQAVFAEAGGLSAGADVTLSGLTVGRVSAVTLQRGKAHVVFTVDGTVGLRDATTAHIRTGTLLGERVLTLRSAGTHRLRPNATIPESRTSAPYSLTDAVEELTANVAATDTDTLTRSLDVLSDTIEQIAPQVGPTFEGLTRISRLLNERDSRVRDLLTEAAAVTDVLASRAEQVNALILNANDLIAVLNDRRQHIVRLLGYASAVARDLQGLVAENEAELAPALERLNSVTAMLERNRDSIEAALPGLAKFQTTQGETVSNGFYYTANIPNLLPGQLLQPFLDYALGFRRGVNAGQPPDNAGPRAELPFPRNGIPGG